MKKILFYTVLMTGFLAAGVFYSCKRTFKDQEFQGQEIVSAPAGFTGVVGSFTACDVNHSCLALDDTVTSSIPGNKLPIFGGSPGASTDSYNAFVAFHATLSHRVTWFITIKARKSGAKQVFTGTSQVIDENSFLWKGRMAEGFLLAGEVCDITLSFLNSDLQSSLLLKIYDDPNFGPYNYAENHIAPIIQGKIQDDYDFAVTSGGILGMRTTYSDLNDGNLKASFVLKNDKKAQGDFSLYMHGTDYNGNGYLGGFATENLTELSNGFAGRFSADSFYYNAYVYGYGRPNSCLMFLLYESDHNTGTYNAAIDDNWQFIQEITWTGWKLVSIKYSDFKAASNPASGGNGNRIREPYKLVGAAMELQSYPTAGKEVETNVDYVIFTYGGPLVK